MLLQAILAVIAMISNAITNRFGYKATQKMMREELQNKLDVVVYSTKVKELHDLRNADREELVALRAVHDADHAELIALRAEVRELQAKVHAK